MSGSVVDGRHAVRASDIAKTVAGTLHGDDRMVTGVCTIGHPRPDQLCFAQDFERAAAADIGASGAILIAPRDTTGLSGSWIGVDNPRLAFARAVTELLAPPPATGVAASAIIHPTAQIGDGVSIGEYCVIGPLVTIGGGTSLSHHVVIGRAVQIGERCTIGSNTVIGEEGFGLAKDADEYYVRIPHLGSVIIGDDVQIGALSSIAAGTIEPTEISQGVRIDDQVFIAHNCRIGENVMIIACAEISGSVTIGKNTWIGPSVSTRDNVSIAADSLVGVGATVTKDLVEPGTYIGSPARLLRAKAG